MARSRAKLPDFVIANGATESTIIQGVAIDDALAIAIGFVSGDAAKTYKIQWSPEAKAVSGSQWFDLNDGTADVTAPNVVGDGCVYPWTSVGSIKLLASAAVGSTCTWNAIKIWEM